MKTKPNDRVELLTKREHLASEAMKGLLSGVDWNISIAGKQHAEATAQFAVMYADLLITTLNKSDGSTIE